MCGDLYTEEIQYMETDHILNVRKLTQWNSNWGLLCCNSTYCCSRIPMSAAHFCFRPISPPVFPITSLFTLKMEAALVSYHNITCHHNLAKTLTWMFTAVKNSYLVMKFGFNAFSAAVVVMVINPWTDRIHLYSND